MKFSSAKLRTWLRAFHLLGMMPLGLVIYTGLDHPVPIGDSTQPTVQG